MTYWKTWFNICTIPANIVYTVQCTSIRILMNTIFKGGKNKNVGPNVSTSTHTVYTYTVHWGELRNRCHKTMQMYVLIHAFSLIEHPGKIVIIAQYSRLLLRMSLERKLISHLQYLEIHEWLTCWGVDCCLWMQIMWLRGFFRWQKYHSCKLV